MKKTLLLLLLSIRMLSQSPQLIQGVFIMERVKFCNLTTCTTSQLTNEYAVSAYFSQTAVANIVPSNYNLAGNVYFDGTKTDYNNNLKFYSKVKLASIDSPKWQVTGSGTIPAMNFIYTGPMPSYSITVGLLKDTLKKQDTLFLNLQNITNADSILVTITDDNQLTPQHTIGMIAPSTASKFYLIPSMLSPLVSSPRTTVSIQAINYRYQTIGGKLFHFRNITRYIRNGIVIIN